MSAKHTIRYGSYNIARNETAVYVDWNCGLFKTLYIDGEYITSATKFDDVVDWLTEKHTSECTLGCKKAD